MSQDRHREVRAESNARLLHRALKRGGPQTKDDLISALGIEAAHFDQAVRFSRRNTDPEDLANEIIAVTNRTPFLYYLAKNAGQAEEYRGHRIKVITGHLDSISALLDKELLKWPEEQRNITYAQRAVERAREDLLSLLG